MNFLVPFFCLSSLTVTAEGGYSNSDFHWDIGRFDVDNDVISELEWKDLKGPYGLIRVRGDFSLQFFAFLEGSGSVSREGRNIDSDYSAPRRKEMYLRTEASAADSPFWGLRGAIGHYFFLFDPSVRLDISIGYRFEKERFKMEKGRPVFSTIGPVVFEGLRSRFVAEWQGFEGNVGLFCSRGPFWLSPTFSIFLPRYSGRGYWNLQERILNPFHHDARGVGFDFRVEAAYQIGSLSFGLNFHLVSIMATNGVDSTFVIDRSGEVIEAKGRLNQTAFNSRVYTLNGSYLF